MAADRSLDFAQMCWCTLGGGVSSIGDRVNGHVLEPLLCGPIEQSTNVIDMAVYATIGAEPEQMKGSTSAAESLGD